MSDKLYEILSTGWSKPEQLTVTEWGSKYLTLPNSPFGSKYRPEMSEYLREPLEALKDDNIREIVLGCSAQSSKSTYLYLALAYLLSENPAPALFIAPTDELSKRFARQRIMPTLEACDKIKDIMPSTKELKQLREIYFSNNASLMIGPANEQFCQAWNSKIITCDEVSRFRSDGILEQIRARATMYHDSKIVLASTFMDDGDDFTRAWERTNQKVYHLRCPNCDGLIKPEFNECIRWVTDSETKPNGEYDYDKIASSTYMVCNHCKAKIDNTDKNWRSMVSGGEYIASNPSASMEYAGYRWNALSLPPHIMSWGTLVTEFLSSKAEMHSGYFGSLKEWVRLRCALPWSDAKANPAPQVKLEPYDSKVDWKDAKYTFLSADIGGQNCDTNWVLVRSFAENGDSMLMHYERVGSFEEIEEIRKQYNIPPHLCAIDSGYQTFDVYKACADYGWSAWKGMELKNESGFPHIVKGRKVYRPYSQPSRVDIKDRTGRKVILFKHSNLLLKDLLYLARTNRTQAKFGVKDVGAYTQFYIQSIEGEVKVPVKSGNTGKPILRWVRTKSRSGNEAVDLEVLCLAMALMVPLPIGNRKDTNNS